VSPSRPKSALPRHVGIIMDGNGRWAEERNKQRAEGHLEGVKAAKRIVKAASDMGLQFLSLYVFSTENWTRAEAEVSYLMLLIRQYLKKEYDFYRANGIRIVHSGDASRLHEDIRLDLESVIRDTAAFKGLTVNLAINYGGKDEILRAVKKLHESVRSGEVTEDALHACLDHPEMPDPDLIIRSGGDIRLSNFLLWESAYAELYFSPKLWPDWDAADLEAAVAEFGHRARRFGGR
jgi:undecaprenyl diphosphate synthase